MAVDDIPDVTEPPRDGMSIHEVSMEINITFAVRRNEDSGYTMYSNNFFSSPVLETQAG